MGASDRVVGTAIVAAAIHPHGEKCAGQELQSLIPYSPCSARFTDKAAK